MAFTYNGTLETDLDRVRFHISDTVSGAGPKPGDANFSDAEITGLLTVEGAWEGAVAAAFETLAGAWARFPSFLADQLRLDRSDIAEQYRKLAANWRARSGSSPKSRSGTRSMTRIDGYSDDVTNTEI
jgi:hypothetical protein